MRTLFLISVFSAGVVVLSGCGGKTTEGTPASTDTAKKDTAQKENTVTHTIGSLPSDPPSSGQAPEAQAAPDGGRNIMIHISSGATDKFSVCMGLKAAEELMKGNRVQVYFDHMGSEVVIKDTPEIEWSPFPPAHQQVEKLIKDGVTVAVCKPCLASVWKKPEDVMNGVRVIEMEEILSFAKGDVSILKY